MKKLRQEQLILLSLVAVSFIIAFVFYSSLPNLIAIHFNFYGTPDLFISKILGIFIFPAMISLLVIFLSYAPQFDKKYKNNFKKFLKYYDYFLLILVAFLIMIYLQVIEFNLGNSNDLVFNTSVGLCVLCFFIGMLIIKSKRNRLVGVRTSLTLSSDKNWAYANVLVGKILQITSLLGLIFLLLIPQAIIFIVFSIFSSAIISSMYAQYRLNQA